MRKINICLTLTLLLFLYSGIVSAATFTVTVGTDEPDGNPGNGQCSTLGGTCTLRAAVQEAQALAGEDTINFQSGVTQVTLTGEISYTVAGGDLFIHGPGANILTINGGIGTNRIFYFLGGVIQVSNVTLTGGNGGGSGQDGAGGAIFSDQATLTLNSVHVTGNGISNGQFVGGVHFRQGTGIIRNSTFSGNSSGTSDCGAFYNDFGTLYVVNTTVSDNTSGNLGGGFCSNGTTTLRNVTISGNTAIQGGGVFIGSGSTLNLANTIIAGNTALLSNPEINNNGASFVSAGNNFIGDSPGDSTSTGTPVTYQMSDIRDQNPQLEPLQNNGGRTPTRELIAGSPAIDAGNNAEAVDPSSGNAPLISDQRGYLRIVNGNLLGAIVDIGAYEFNAAPTAANVSVAGRVVFGNGGGGRTRAIVLMIDAEGNTRTAAVNPFGFFKFEDVAVGQSYTVQVSAKGASFDPQVITPTENIEELTFTAN